MTIKLTGLTPIPEGVTDGDLQAKVLEVLQTSNNVYLKAGNIKARVWRALTDYDQIYKAWRDAGRPGGYAAGPDAYPPKTFDTRIAKAIKLLYRANVLYRTGQSTATAYAEAGRAVEMKQRAAEQAVRDEANALRAHTAAAALTELGVPARNSRGNVIIDFETAEALIRRLENPS